MSNSFRGLLASPISIAKLIDSFIWLSILVMALLTSLLSFERYFDHDEFEAIKTAWKLYSGERIYVDFFQHHHPFLYFLLIPLLSLFGETIAVILAARFLILSFTFGILLTTYKIARLFFSGQVAAISVIFLLAITLFVDKAIEVRPDVPQTLFGLISVFLLFKYFASGRVHHLILSSLSLGIAFLFLQKILLLTLLLTILVAWRCFMKQLTLQALLLFPSVFVCPWLIYCIYLLLMNQFSQYIFFNFDFNFAKLENHRYQTAVLISHVKKSFNGVIFFGFLLFTLTNKRQEHRELAFLACALLALAAIYRTQFAQYYLVAFPLVAIVASRGFEYLAQLRPVVALPGLVAVLIVPAAYYIHEIRTNHNHLQLDKVKYVYERTNKSDYVYDGDTQFNLFRKDLDFFWYGVSPDGSLNKYRSLKGYDYNVYSLIDKFKPKVISDNQIDNLNDPVIQYHYIPSYYFKGLYLRTGDPGQHTNDLTSKKPSEHPYVHK